MTTWRAPLLIAALGMIAACGGAGGGDAGAENVTATTPGSAATAPDATAPGSDATIPTSEAPTTTAAPTTTTTVDREPVADAVLIEAAVDLRELEALAFAPLADPTPVAVGDVLRTDLSGYAEVAYFDGSRTRLDVDTEFEILALVDDAGQSTARTRMGLGRTWHRVESLGEGEGGFSVETSVATATVRGTAFSVECRTVDACR
ncbi:MAG: FecR domain-containing protein, partial [Ilumatobacteraceae bacterium]